MKHSAMGISMKNKTLTCQRPDRHVSKLVCGHPLPCPYHTVVISQDDLFGGVLKEDDETKQEADNREDKGRDNE